MRVPTTLPRVLALLAALLAAADTARANDSSSELAAGGLVFVRTDAVAIEREDLSIAPRQVRVRYAMRNAGTAPVTLRLAFPLPPIPADTPGGRAILDAHGQEVAGNIDLRGFGRPNFVDFTVTADGKPVTPEVEVRAVLPDGRDIAAELRQIGGWSLLLYPRLYVSNPTPQDMAEYDVGPTILGRLRELGAVGRDKGDDSYGWPLWRTLVTFHWMQTFRPGVTVIEHSYFPVTGGFWFNRDGNNWKGGARGAAASLNDAYCIDAAQDGALRAMLARADDHYLRAVTLAYVLSTGANWAGPIRTFHLMLDGERGPGPDAKVRAILTCTEMPLTRTGPVRLEGTAHDYLPRRDLNILMVE